MLLLALHASAYSPPGPFVRQPVQLAHRRAATFAAPHPVATSRTAVISASAAHAVPQQQPPLARVVVRAALAFVASLLALVLSSARVAFAASRRSSTAGVSIISGDVIKYGFVGGCIAVSYFFRKEETPVVRETPGAVQLDPETLKAPEIEAPKAKAPVEQLDDAVQLGGDAIEPVFSTDDSDLFGSLRARMESLATESEESAEGDADTASMPSAESSDSTDGWGEGSTAVLEPPRDDAAAPPAEGRGVFDGEPAVDFPPGFPLVDGEVDTTPAANEDQIAMFNRMMGGGGGDSE